MNVHRERESIFQLSNILLNGTKSNPELNQLLRNLLAEGSEHHLGYLVNERLINMPVQTAPPMYTMLQEEIQWALEDKEPYNFEYFFLVSKTYRETQLNPDLQEVRHGEGGKKQKAQVI
jgi:protein BCP1